MPIAKLAPWEQSLKMINNCPVCGKDYDLKAARLFSDKEKAQIVHIVCNACKGYFVAMVMDLGRGISTIGMVTDLSYSDIERLRDAKPIDIDEVIDGHQLVEQLNFNSFLR